MKDAAFIGFQADAGPELRNQYGALEGADLGSMKTCCILWHMCRRRSSASSIEEFLLDRPVKSLQNATADVIASVLQRSKNSFSVL
jgi:hypothetical protein